MRPGVYCFRMEFELESATDILRRTPATLRALLENLGEAWVRGREGPGTFSAFDNLGHLIDGEETDWIPRARIILARGPSVRFTPYDRFRHYQRNRDRTLESLLEEFELLRSRNLAELHGWKLSPADLELPGEHPALGGVTLRQLLAAWVAHDLGHLAQIARVLAKQYRDAVGPWIQYLPVLTDHETPRS